MASSLPLRVLVVDNEELICDATTGMLERLGYRADRETDSLNALKNFSENPGEFDLAVIEPVLPNLSGLDLAVRFRHIRPDFPVLFYAGFVDEPLSRQIKAAGLGKVVHKPLTLKELETTIKNRLCLRRRSLHKPSDG